jgi:hypothetical protein
MEQTTFYGYNICFDEPGFFEADVLNTEGKTTFEIRVGHHLAENEAIILEGGSMRSKYDFIGLTHYLRNQKIIAHHAQVLPMDEFKLITASNARPEVVIFKARLGEIQQVLWSYGWQQGGDCINCLGSAKWVAFAREYEGITRPVQIILYVWACPGEKGAVGVDAIPHIAFRPSYTVHLNNELETGAIRLPMNVQEHEIVAFLETLDRSIQDLWPIRMANRTK